MPISASKRVRRHDIPRLCQTHANRTFHENTTFSVNTNFHSDFPNAMEVYNDMALKGFKLTATADGTVPADCNDLGKCTLSECLQLCYETVECVAAIFHYAKNTANSETCTMMSIVTAWSNVTGRNGSACTTVDCPAETAIKCSYDLGSMTHDEQYAMANYIFTGGKY